MSMLGVLKSGASFLPLQPDIPQERLSAILQDAGATVILTDTAGEEDIQVEDVNVVAIEHFLWFWAEEKRSLEMAVASTDPAYVIYTSGSTGTPKGVSISHQSLLNYEQWFSTTHQITAADNTLLFTSAAFDLCYTSIWSSLLRGAGLYLLEESAYLDGEVDRKSVV